VAADGAAKTDDGEKPRTTLLIVAAYAVLTFAMTLPFSWRAGTSVVADLPDTHLFVWTLAWDTHAFLHHPLRIFDANIYYPFANTLAYSENLIGSALFAAPIIWLTGNLVLAMNLTALITCWLCGAGAYLLARRLHLSVAAAFICGLIFEFAPPRFFRLGQLHLTAVQWMPFCLAFLHTYLERGRRRDLLIALGCFSLQALSSGHGAAYLFLAIIALLAWRLLAGMPLQLGQRLRDVGAAGAYLIAPAVWVIIPYRMAQADAGLRRGYLSDAQPGIESFLASPTLFHRFLQTTFIGPFAKEPDAFLFPGLLVLVLAAIGIASRSTLRRWRDNHTLFYLLIGLGSLLMFIDRPFELWKYVYWLPGFNFIRVPSRFILLVMLALAVLAGIGVDRLSARMAPRSALLATIAIAALLLGEYASFPFSNVPYRVDIPAIDRWLDTRDKPFVVAEIPVPSPGDLGALERQQTTSMLHATAHWQKTIHGYSGMRRPFHDQLYLHLTAFPDAQSLASLREVGDTYLVVHTDAYTSNDRWRMVEEQIAKTPALTLEHVEGAGRVYSLRRPQ
jgi:hypothetical protein